MEQDKGKDRHMKCFAWGNASPMQDNQHIIPAPHQLISIMDAELKFVRVNKAFADKFGIEPKDAVGRTCHSLSGGTECPPGFCPGMETISEGGEHVYEVQEKGQGSCYQICVSPMYGESGVVAGSVHIVRDITDRKRIEREREMAEAILTEIDYAISVQDTDFKILYQNRRHREMAGLQTGLYCYSAYERKDRVCEWCPMSMTFRDGGRYTVLRRTDDNFGRFLEISTFAFRDRSGSIVAGLEVIRDVTAHVRAEEELRASNDALEQRIRLRTAELERMNEVLGLEVRERMDAEEALMATLWEKDLLIKEVHHRIKNNLSIISSLLHLQSSRIKDREAMDMIKDTQCRVKSMSIIHEKLYRSAHLSSVDLLAYVRALVSDILQSYGTESTRIKVEIEIPEISMDIDTLIPCGLIINELMTNALKYAFTGRGEGLIRISAGKIDTDLCILSVRDNGAGLPEDLDPYKTETLGMQIVTSLAKQINATIEILRDGGTEFRLSFREKRFKKR